MQTPPHTLRIATRQSPLALWQAQFVKAEIQAIAPHMDICLVPMVTQGDILLDDSLAKIGGKGLFTKELERALLNGDADIAVHSMKDVAAHLPDGLQITAILERANPFDAFVSNTAACLDSLPPQAIVGTSSLRRQSQLHHLRPDLIIKPLRGNVNSRLGKLDAGEFDAIILAVSGLERLGMGDRIRAILDDTSMIPAPAQGALGIECCSNNPAIQTLLAPLNHAATRLCVEQERIINATLGGNCTSPLAAYASLNDKNVMTLRACIALPDGSRYLRMSESASSDHIQTLGLKIAAALQLAGAKEIMEQC